MTRWDEVARLIADAHGIGPGTKVSIFVTDGAAQEAVVALVAETYRRGGLPQVIAADEQYDTAAIIHASDSVLDQPAPVELWSMQWADVHVSFRAMVPPQGQLDESRVARLRAAKGVIATERWRRTRWTVVRVPTAGWAELIGQPHGQLMEEFFEGCLRDWSDERSRLAGLCARLNQTQRVHVVDRDTDLTFGTAGRRWVPFVGTANLPDGEVATAPIDDSAQGWIRFPGRFWFSGVELADLELVFDRGEVVDVSATRGAAFARRLIAMDAGARRVGELGIGTAASIRTITGDLFIDEKILGTVHLALGRAYPECGGVNESALHWDIVKDLRSGGTLLADDVVYIDEGRPTQALGGADGAPGDQSRLAR